MLHCLLACTSGVVLAIAPSSAHAATVPHDPGMSAMTVAEEGNGKAVVRLEFSNTDFASSTRFDANHDGTLSEPELVGATPGLPTWIASNVWVKVGDIRYPCCGVHAVIGEDDDVELTLEYELPRAPANGAGSADLERAVSLPFLTALPHGHRCYAQAAHVDALLHARSSRFVLPHSPSANSSSAAAANGSLAGAFFVLGVEHILIGYDHLAFLLALLAVGVTLRRTLLTITAFSLAHSLTLTAAALDWLQLPGNLVEASIAGSIVVVALANLTQRHRTAPHRWPLAFAFGLLHGFGFAGVLAEFEVQSGAVLVPLLSFNLGVEAGQILCAAAAFPVLAALTRRRPMATSISLSVLAGAMGLYWLLERTL